MISTDDPAFFRTSLDKEFTILIKEMKFSKKEVMDLVKNGFAYAFAYIGS